MQREMIQVLTNL